MDGWTSLPDKLFLCTNLSTNAKLVAWMLFKMRDKHTGVSYPTVRQISKQWNIGKTSVSKAIKDLEQAGIISIKAATRRRKDPKHRPNHMYRINPMATWTLSFDVVSPQDTDSF